MLRRAWGQVSQPFVGFVQLFRGVFQLLAGGLILMNQNFERSKVKDKKTDSVGAFFTREIEN